MTERGAARLRLAGASGYVWDSADRITRAGATGYTVNNAGNLVGRGSDSFGYDRANRLITATVGGVTSTNTYDGDGKRITRTVGLSPTAYVYDVNRSLPVVLDDGSRKYVLCLGLAYAVDSAGNVNVYYSDGLGSIRAVGDITGTIVQTYRTDEFGVPILSQGVLTQPFEYTGEQRDGETGLVYLRARMYEPGTGRFVSRDRYGGAAVETGSIHRYTYAYNRPTILGDPSGYCVPPSTPVCVVGGAAIAGGGAAIGGAALGTGAAIAGAAAALIGGIIASKDQIAAGLESVAKWASRKKTDVAPSNPSNAETYHASVGTPSDYPPDPRWDPNPKWGPSVTDKLLYIGYAIFRMIERWLGASGNMPVVVPPPLYDGVPIVPAPPPERK